jgi:hypothetical protein
MGAMIEVAKEPLAVLKERLNSQLLKAIDSVVDAHSEPVAGFQAAT